MTELQFEKYSITLKNSHITTIYSDTDIQEKLVNKLLDNNELMVLNRRDGLYERLTVEENIKFYHKWFQFQIPVSEILVQFELYHCTKKRIIDCTVSELRRVYFAKYFIMSEKKPIVLQEPIHGVDILTINTFINMLKKLSDNELSVLVLVTNLEHAILLGDTAYRLQEKGLSEIEMEAEDKEKEERTSTTPKTADLYKIPVNVDDKVILFEPTEIDYIEGQDGKAHIVINEESYILSSTLMEIEDKLKMYGFYRCHRSYIVNLQKVREIITWSKNTYSLRIDNKVESTIPLSRTKIQEIKGLFNLK